jgi:cytochrome c biogenesis factor
VNWLWLGGLVMALGGAAAAWPGRRRRRPGGGQGAAMGRERTAVEAGTG